jgi:hypothetical protein
VTLGALDLLEGLNIGVFLAVHNRENFRDEIILVA